MQLLNSIILSKTREKLGIIMENNNTTNAIDISINSKKLNISRQSVDDENVSNYRLVSTFILILENEVWQSI